MAFIGTPLDTRNTFQSLQGKRFSGDGSTTAFTLDVAPSSTLDIEVFVGNVRQDPNSAYTLSGTTLTFTGAPPSGTNNIYVVHQAKSVGTIDVPTDGVSTASIQSSAVTTAKINADAITGAKIADDSISDEHLDITAITGQTAITSLADTDKFLVSDASDSGNLKYVEKQYLPSGVSTLLHEASITNETGGHDDYTDSAYFHPTNYDRYRVYIDEYEPASDGSNLLLQLFLGDELRTGNYYEYHTKLFQSNSDAAVNRNSTGGAIRIIDDTGNSSQESARCWFEYGSHETDSSAFFKLIQYSFVTKTSGGTTQGGWGAGTTEESTGLLYGFRLIPSAGGLGNYKIRIYGMKS